MCGSSNEFYILVAVLYFSLSIINLDEKDQPAPEPAEKRNNAIETDFMQRDQAVMKCVNMADVDRRVHAKDLGKKTEPED